jgi:predicted dehydrogenase
MAVAEFARIGFVGCGSHSTNNLYPVLKYARCRLQAVCDLDEQLARRNAAVFGGAATYADVDAMLAEQALDGVMVVGTPKMHFEIGRKVLARGLPLFVEKPPAPDLKSTEELAALARSRKTFLMTGCMKRHALVYARVRRLIAERKFEPASAFLRYVHWPMKDLAGMLLFMGIHPIDLAIALFGDVAEVTSVLADRQGALSLGLTLRFASGVWAQLMLGSAARIQERLEITGRMDGKGALLTVENVQHLELHTQGRNGIDVVRDGKTLELHEIRPEFDLEDIKVWRPDFGIPNMGQNSAFLAGYAGEVREFVDAILEKREPCPGTDDALKAMRVVQAVLDKPNGTSSRA